MVCDDGYIGVNDGFYECDVSTGGGAGEDDSECGGEDDAGFDRENDSA